MKDFGLSDSIGDAAGPTEECSYCGQSSTIGHRLCVNCLLQRALNPQETNDETNTSFDEFLAHINIPNREWRLGNYEILEEIARGGMGVVYRARQRHSRRIVAVKRILSYHADSRETLERFRREAEAVASLDHPNILPIYEVSESEGMPFFSMKYAAGGSLRDARTAFRSKPRVCVALLAKVSRATEYAHRQGILHRDLKPGNILLDSRAEPLVSDFGLAKWLDTSTDLTRTLAVFGTPGYIAPEQAGGAAPNLTPAADVYSLGAVVFDLLAGRPPFLGDHALAVIKQAAEKPAPKLRSLVPAADRDLETICARCLEREPAARYQSAAALADDLECWLERKPIKARRVLPPARMWRWSRRNPKLIATAAACLLMGATAIWLFRGAPEVVPHISAPEGSIAVLPFENLSSDKENAYFAEGIQDEILTRLSKIADLKVISRTSTQHYKSAPRNLPEVAMQLGVAHILEGSVQRSGDTVRVSVKLIKAAEDLHLWADTFDRKLTDIFSVESEVAKTIADQLRVKLTGREEQAITAKPTDNPEAYDAYLRGLAYSLKTASSSANSLGAQRYLREAVRLDPKFALGWALLSIVEARGYLTLTLQPTIALRDEIRQASENALTLQPNLGEAVLAKGSYYYSCLKDYDAAVRYFEQARPLLPNNSRIPELLAYVERRRGEWNRSESHFNEAERLDPRNASLLGQHAQSYIALRRFPEALRKLDQVLKITPDDMDTFVYKAAIAQANGDLPHAAALLAPLHPNADDSIALETQVYQAILERRPAPVIARLKEILATPDTALGYYNGELRFYLAWAQEVAGEHSAAEESWRQARSELEPFLKEQPENYEIMGYLALSNSGLGDKAAALSLAEHAIRVIPIEKDAIDGCIAMEILARVTAQIGESDQAITILQKLLSIPSSGPLASSMPLTPALLKLDPMFDPLRNDLRFQKLVATVTPKEIAARSN
jgi:serine/threonine protein kinase/Tfp pilus assembly protein PilF